MRMFTLRDLCHQRGGRTVLQVAELAIDGPGLVALSGPNGAGKTTLLRLLSGRLERPTHGHIERAVTPMETVLVDQHPYLFADTVAANVAYGLKVRGMGGQARDRRVAHALDQVGMAGHGPRRAAGLSGGQSRRVALARALAVDPAVLLLDEPDAGLDQGAVDGLERILIRLAGERLVVFSTHDRERSRRLAGRVIALNDGRLTTLERVVRP